MKILIIGGTKFSGRHLVKSALKNNHEVTIFHRGKHPSGDLGNVEEILGDRNFDLEKLKNRTWDAVVDMCGYLPQWVESSANALKDSVGKYVFISSVSVYDEVAEANYDESAKLNKLTYEQEKRFAEIDEKGDFNAADLGEMYGALKVLCEEEVQKTFTENHLIIRPGLIVGEYDFTDRFTYWVMRVGRGGEVLAPANPDAPVQFIDAKDLAEWIIKLIENDEKGIYNAVNKPFEITFGNLLKTIKEVSGSNAEFTWVSEEFMDENNVAPWSEMPLHLPESLEFMRTANVDKALAKGLKIRALSETIRETLDWRKTQDEEMKAGISAEREKKLLEKWHK
ncbi:MAG: NAD-dependent epimerase/dehydratase family protein [Acidobacteriota bacterium]|nr:NAD-dependent epimerase/dehydratase family protein [Acidobacteriota bacterium]